MNLAYTSIQTNCQSYLKKWDLKKIIILLHILRLINHVEYKLIITDYVNIYYYNSKII